MDLKSRLERAKQAHDQARTEAGCTQGNGQATDPKHEKVGPTEWSEAGVRLDNFKKSNGRLSKNKSQLPNLAVQSRIFPPTKKGRRQVFDWREVQAHR